MLLSVIIVNYNVRHFLEQCLLSVREAVKAMSPLQGAGVAEVWVVDNASSDDSVAMVRAQFPEVQIIANQQNTGFAVANNQAIRQSQGKYVLLLNPDTVVQEDTFRKCVDFMEAHPEAGGLGVKMIDGSGQFLPESKRGFPSPFVAFSKTFGLSKFFPKSRLFNRYHLGFLDKNQTHEVDVLAGAFMLMSRKTLDKTGLLDEAFFMYGEDIDLSYRIVQAGYLNYYFADTVIIHYKGESTKKGSINYVRTFYQAMIIFARKHFHGQQARLYIAMIYGAIWLRAGLTLAGHFFKKSQLPLLDGGLIAGGLVLVKNFWANYFYHDPHWFKPAFLQFNVPLYTALWLGSLYFSGAYDEPFNLRRLTRGLLLGTVVIAAVYGFLPLVLRPSRAVILLGTAWALGSLALLRTGFHFFKTGNLSVGESRIANLAIVGSAEETERVRQLLARAAVQKNYIGRVEAGMSPKSEVGSRESLGTLGQLDETAEIYRLDELIFCLQDVSAGDVIHWMEHLGPRIEYKTVPPGSHSIIGSSSKNTAGELYTLETRFAIATPTARRNKRLLDLAVCFAMFPLSIFIFFGVKNGGAWLKNLALVLLGKKSWTGYALPDDPVLPNIRPGVLLPTDAFPGKKLDVETQRRLDFFYAKDWTPGLDLKIIWKGWRRLGQKS